MWQAREDYWNYIRSLLESSVGIDAAQIGKDHSAISKAIEEFSKSVPDSAFYYAYIFVFDTLSSDPARGLAGLLFKNKLRASVDCLDESQVEELIATIRKPLINLLVNSNSSSFIQRTVGSILSTLVTDCNGLVIWSSLLEELIVAESFYAFLAIERICEDAAFELIDHAHIFEPFLKAILGSLQQGNVQDERIMHSLLSIITHLIPTQSPLLTGNISFIVGVVEATKSEDCRVISCRLLSTLVEFYWPLLQVDQIQAIFKIVLNWTLESSRNRDSSDLLKQSLEFWLLQVQSDYAGDLFQCASASLLGQLIPLLVDRCAYDEEEDEEELCKAMEDLSVPDESDDLKPRHSKRKDSDDSDTFDTDDSSDDTSEIVTSIRKCSAATLDGLSLALPDPALFLQIFLPAFNDRVGSSDWKVREGALLAFGAIAEGLWPRLTEHLEQIVSFLLGNAHSHPHPLVRSMSLWTLSRLSNWLLDADAVKSEYLRILIGSLGDANKRVQQSASTALCKFLESSSTEQAVLSIDDCKSLISAIFLALKCYQKQSLLVLYDLIRVFASTSAPVDNLLTFDPEALQYWRSIGLVLLDRFSPGSIADSSIFPIIEALMSLLLCDFEGLLFEPARREELHFRALNLAAQNLSAFTPDLSAETIVNEGLDDFLIAALDLLAAAVESSRIVPSVELQPLLRSVLAASLLFKESSNVRQSAFALFGDYTISTGNSLFDDSITQAYFTALNENIFPSSLQTSSNPGAIVVSMATATNAVWSLGEFALLLGQNANDQLTHFTSVLISILKDRKTLEAGARIYFENVAVCLGRLLRLHNNNNTICLSSDTFNVVNRIFNLLTTVESDTERSTAISGYLRVLKPTCNTQQFCFVIGKVNELIDFSNDNVTDPILIQSISGYKSAGIDASFYDTLQPNLRNLLS